MSQNSSSPPIKYGISNRYICLALTFALSASFGLLFFVLGRPVRAADLSKSFTASQQLANGAIVSFTNSSKDEVTPSNTSQQLGLAGVVVSSDSSLLAVDPQTGKVQVDIAGEAQALVSDLNGPIHKGSYVAVTNVSGVGAAYRSGDTVVGIALADFNTNAAGNQQATITQNGVQKQITIGLLPIEIAIGVSPQGEVAGAQAVKSTGWLAAVAGKPVSTFRVVISAAIAAVMVVATVTMILAAIKHGLQASGRNPLAKNVIFRTLSEVMAMVALVAVFSVGLILAVLRI